MKKLFGVCKLLGALCFISALLVGSAEPVYAQWQPAAKKSAQKITKNAAQAARPEPRNVPAAVKKPLSEDNKRLYYSLMTKVGISQRKALNYLYKHGAQPTRYSAPCVSATEIRLKTLPAAVYNQEVPPYPFTNPKRVFYRGISVDEEGLRNILYNGLRAQDSGTHHSDFAIFTYQNKTLLDMANQMIGENKNICLISDPQRAQAYALRRAETDGKTPVVIQVKNTIPVIINPVGAGVLATGNISASQILRVSALIPVNGTLMWGDIHITPAGDFAFKPYETK